MRYVLLLCISLIVSGCASIKEDVGRIENDISRSKSNISNSQRWLQQNPDVYTGGRCVTPSRGAEPRLSCRTQEDAKNTGLAICALKYKGCDAAVKALGDQLEGADKRFLASQACEQKLAEVLGEKRTADEVVVDGVFAAADNWCETGGFWGKTIGCLYSVSGKITKFAQFMACTKEITSKCQNNYQEWVNGPSKRKYICEESLRIIPKEEQNLRRLQSELYEKKDSLAWKLFGN
jgi:hypothetical protein